MVSWMHSEPLLAACDLLAKSWQASGAVRHSRVIRTVGSAVLRTGCCDASEAQHLGTALY